MKAIKRILGVVMMLISLLMGLLSIGGIFGTWSLSNSLTRGAVTVLSGADRILGTTEDSLNQLDSRVGTARDQVTSFEEAVVSSAEDFADKPVVLTALSERLDLGIGPAVSELRDTVQSIRETLMAVQQTIEAINSLPFVSLGENLPGGEKLTALSDGITALNEGVQQARDGIREAKAEAAAEVVLRIGKATARLDSGLARIETATTGMSMQVSEARFEVSALQERLTFWLDVGAAALTVLFLWFLFAHIVTFVLGLSLLRNKNLFARWLGPPPARMTQPIQVVEPVEPEVRESPQPAEPAESVEVEEPAEPAEPVEAAEATESPETAEADEPAEAATDLEPEETEPSEVAMPQEGDNGER
jgi:hypothetical protein